MMTTGEKMIWAAAWARRSESFMRAPQSDRPALMVDAAKAACEAVECARGTSWAPLRDEIRDDVAVAMLREMVAEETALPGDIEHAMRQLENMADDWEANADDSQESVLADAKAARLLIAHVRARRSGPGPMAAVREHLELARDGGMPPDERRAWWHKLRELVGAKP